MTQQKPSTDQMDCDLPTSPETLMATLDDLGVAYDLHHHEAVHTVAESAHLDATIPGTHCRNLFVRDKKQNMFLVVLANDTQVDLKHLQTLLDCGRLSFGSADRLWTYLALNQALSVHLRRSTTKQTTQSLSY